MNLSSATVQALKILRNLVFTVWVGGVLPISITPVGNTYCLGQGSGGTKVPPHSPPTHKRRSEISLSVVAGEVELNARPHGRANSPA